MRARRSLGFTLLELLIVVAIIGVLATLILSGLASARRRTQIAVAKNNISAIRAALQMYETDTGRYPTHPNHATDTGNNLFQNDIAYAWAALRNRRTLQYGGGPNSPYLEWKPEQVGKISATAVLAYNFGCTTDGNTTGCSNQVIAAGGNLLDPSEYDQVMGNDANYFSRGWSTLNPTNGSGTLVPLDPWGNPFVYVEWADVPQATKDSVSGPSTSGSVSIQSNLGGGTGGGDTHYLHPHDPSKFDIYSFGPNGVNEGGEGDDVTSWSSIQK